MGINKIIFIIFLLLFLSLSIYLFLSKNYIKNSTKIQQELGRNFIAKYQNTKFYFYFVKTISLLMVLFSIYLIYRILFIM